MSEAKTSELPSSWILICVGGVPGSGKTEFTTQLSKALRAKPFAYDEVVATQYDQYRSTKSHTDACSYVEMDINKVTGGETPDSTLIEPRHYAIPNRRCLIVDTCSTKIDLRNVYGHDLTADAPIVYTYIPNLSSCVSDYLNWSLYNVMNRTTKIGLTPKTQSVVTILDVFGKKRAQFLNETKLQGTEMHFRDKSLGAIKSELAKRTFSLKLIPIDKQVELFLKTLKH